MKNQESMRSEREQKRNRNEEERMPKKRKQADSAERPIPAGAYQVFDMDLARDNLENDIPAADLNDL